MHQWSYSAVLCHHGYSTLQFLWEILPHLLQDLPMACAQLWKWEGAKARHALQCMQNQLWSGEAHWVPECAEDLGQALFVTEEAPIVPALYHGQPKQKRSVLACRGSTAHSVFKFTGRRILTALMEKRYLKNGCILDSWWVLLLQLPVLLPSNWALSVIYHIFTLFHAIGPFLFAVGWLW